MVFTDYKFAYISRRDDGNMQFEMRFYEIEFNPDLDFEGEVIGLERLGFVKRPESHFSTVPRVSLVFDEDGNAVTLTLPMHINDTALIRMMNVVLARDSTRTPIDARKVRP